MKALFVSVLIVSLLLKINLKPSRILLVAFIFYFVGLFDSSWYGIILPLRTGIPTVWNIMRIAKRVFVTTRNGLFFGFVYVSAGMYFANYRYRMKKTKVGIGFSISMLFY